MGDVQHNCGFSVAHSLRQVYSLMEQLQHRGRDAAGIAAISDKRIDVVKWQGRVESFGIDGLVKLLGDGGYHTYMGHVRYATRGRKDKILDDAHPHVIGGHQENRGSHVVIFDCELAVVHNGQVEESYLKDVDRSLLQTNCDTEALLHYFRRASEHQLMRQIHGAFTMAIADKRRRDVIVMRDKTGIKPGVLGVIGGKSIVASEDVAIKRAGGVIVEDLAPGSVYYLTPDGQYRDEVIVPPAFAHCFFEWTYVGHRDSAINGLNVHNIRTALGEMLEEEFHPSDVDIVTYLPNCPEIAARSYAKRMKARHGSRVEFDQLFYKVKDERAFQGPDAAERAASIRANLHLLPNAYGILPGRTVLMIDDSTIRGNNARWAKKLLTEAGAKSVYLANYIPPMGIIGVDGVARGCEFGVDMPPNPPPGEEFVARGRTIEQIGEAMGMPVAYLSLDGMLRAFERAGMPRDKLCHYCVGGPHPFAGL